LAENISRISDLRQLKLVANIREQVVKWRASTKSVWPDSILPARGQGTESCGEVFKVSRRCHKCRNGGAVAAT
jgi:hypothetical protein